MPLRPSTTWSFLEGACTFHLPSPKYDTVSTSHIIISYIAIMLVRWGIDQIDYVGPISSDSIVENKWAITRRPFLFLSNVII